MDRSGRAPPPPPSYQNSPPPASTTMNGSSSFPTRTPPPPSSENTPAASPPTDDESDAGGAATQHRGNRRSRSRSRRSSTLLQVVRRAFSIDTNAAANAMYSLPNGSSETADDDDDRDDRDDDSVIIMDDDDPAPRRWLLGAFAVLAVLAATSLSVKRHRKVITPAQQQQPNGGGGVDGVDEDNIICQDESAAAQSASQSLVVDLEHAAVATDQAVCSQLATRVMMDNGGNAVDAAVAAALCLGVANPSSSGLGGGAFLLVHAAPTVASRDDLPDFVDARDNDSNNATTEANVDTAEQAHGGKITEVIDCRETAPAAAAMDMYDGLPAAASVRGGLAVAVMAELRCLELAHAKFGSLPWGDVVEPAAQLAQQGVPVSPYLARVLQDWAQKAQQNGADGDGGDGDSTTTRDYGLRDLVTRTGDWKTVLQEGQLLPNGALAAVLRDVQQRGADALYGGERAEQLAQEIRDAGGIVTAQDLQNYRATLRSPVSTSVSGFRLVGVPPPSSGGAAVLGAAQFLGGFAAPLASSRTALSQHRLVEAFKHVFSVRLSLSDPGDDVNSDRAAVCREAVRDLTGPAYMALLRTADYYRDNATLPLSRYGGPRWAQLNDTEAALAANATDAQEGDRRVLRRRRQLLSEFGYLEDRGTSHFSIVDAAGNAVAMTTSINTVFGSAVVSPSTGIIFGNTMDDFGKPGLANHYGLKPSEANFIQPGKKPLSSMSPTLVFRQSEESSSSPSSPSQDQLVLALGASGGPKIITAVTQVLLNHLVLGMPLLESVVRPRLHDQLLYHNAAVTTTEKVALDDGLTIDVPQRTRDALTRRGHALLDVNYMGTVQAVSVDPETGRLSAACDPRKGGSPAGY